MREVLLSKGLWRGSPGLQGQNCPWPGGLLPSPCVDPSRLPLRFSHESSSSPLTDCLPSAAAARETGHVCPTPDLCGQLSARKHLKVRLTCEERTSVGSLNLPCQAPALCQVLGWCWGHSGQGDGCGSCPHRGGEVVLIMTSSGFWATRSTADHGCPRVPEPGLGTELSLLGDSLPGVPVGP